MKAIKTLLLLCMIFMGSSIYAQNIKAVLVDSSTGDPIGFATVSLTREGQTKPTKYVLSTDAGAVKLESVRRGTYTLKAELLGYVAVNKEVKMENKDIDLGTIKMEVDSEQIDAATVSAVGNPIIIKKDTIEYNASSFKTTDNDVLEDLLKKLPGVEVSDEGAVTVNGESVSKITIDGKTFFLDDPQLASKNIPAKLINKLKVIRKKSEQSEFTGIDDGQEETVIDLSVQPGMMKGLFGNIQAGAGADWPSTAVDPDFRYQGNGMIGRFTQESQLSLILNANNTNGGGATDRAMGQMQGMRGGGGGGRGGITSSYMIGANAAGNLFDDRMEIGGNYVLNGSQNDIEQVSDRTTYLTDYNKLNHTESNNSTKSMGHRFGLRLEHEFSKNTSILFQPEVNFGNSNYVQSSRDATYNDVNGNVSQINDATTHNTGNNKNVSAGGNFLFRQRLGIPGRTLTANVRFNVSNNDMDGINNNQTRTYDDPAGPKLIKDVNQNFTNISRNYSLNGRVTYTEPLGDYFYLEGNYSYNWSKSDSEKETFDIATKNKVDEYSSVIVNENRRQEIGTNLLFQNQTMRFQLGFSAQPQYTRNSTVKGTADPREYEDRRWNFSPQAMLFGDFSDNLNFRLNYRGTSNQPSINQLMPVPDNTDPLNISFGNPELTPYFNHNMSMDLRYSNREKFSSFNVSASGGIVQNPIVNMTWYNNIGTQYSIPFNGKNTANARLNFFFNLPIGQSAFSINNTLGSNWSKRSSYVGNNIDMTVYDQEGFYKFMDWFIKQFNDPAFYAAHIIENTTNTISANDRLRVSYRGEAIDINVGASTNMNHSWYSISANKEKTTTWNNQVNASFTWNWAATGIGMRSDFSYNWYRGYTTDQPSQCVLNAEITKLIFNNTATIALRGSDLLGQSKNLMVSDNGNFHNESVSNTLGRYVILAFTVRFGTMGRGRGGMMGGRGGYNRGGDHNTRPAANAQQDRQNSQQNSNAQQDRQNSQQNSNAQQDRQNNQQMPPRGGRPMGMPMGGPGFFAE